MKRAEWAGQVARVLKKRYPEAVCSLGHGNPYELWVATVLSAQCTDERVNLVTPALFRRCPDVRALSAIPLPELEALVHSTGFFRNKAKHLKAGAQMILDRFGGELPRTMEELLEIPGVARKTANVVLGNAFGKNEGFVVDTHVGRLSRRMGLTRHDDPVKVERDLMALFPRKSWALLSHQMVYHGRALCRARTPDCAGCPLTADCPKVGV